MNFGWIKVRTQFQIRMRKREWHLSSIWCHVIMLTRIIIVSSASGRLLEICPRDNNNWVYYLSPCLLLIFISLCYNCIGYLYSKYNVCKRKTSDTRVEIWTEKEFLILSLRLAYLVARWSCFPDHGLCISHSTIGVVYRNDNRTEPTHRMILLWDKSSTMKIAMIIYFVIVSYFLC